MFYYKVQRINKVTKEVNKKLVGERLFKTKKKAQEYADWLNYLNSDDFENVLTAIDTEEEFAEEAMSKYIVVKCNGDERRFLIIL